jgi:Ca2+-binding EF-hand superfamily protein
MRNKRESPVFPLSIMGNEQAKLSPEELRELEDSTYFDKRELQKWFREFMKDCPSGSLSKDDFIRLVAFTNFT